MKSSGWMILIFDLHFNFSGSPPCEIVWCAETIIVNMLEGSGVCGLTDANELLKGFA